MTGAAPSRWRPSPFLLGSAALHVAAGAAVAAMPSWWLPLLALAVADHAAIVAAGLLPRCSWLGPNLRRLPSDAVARGEVALTFDDGPDPELTPAVLALLEEHGARASFFAIGKRVERHFDVAAEIASRGHRVENHTFSHPHTFFFLPPAAIGRQLDRAQQAVASATGRAPRYLRAPAGIRGPLLEPVLAQRGLHLVSWTRRAFDTVATDPRRIAARLLADVAAGDILLLHDARHRLDPHGCRVLLPALAEVLSGLADRGLTAVPLPDPPTAA